MKTNANRIFGLDVFRAIAIVLVVLGHGGFMLTNTPLDGFPYVKTLDGVDVFFVLSGFLIGGILLKELHKADYFGAKQLFYFWKRRWFRTLPAYYLILGANYAVVRFGVIEEQVDKFSFHFLTFTQNFKEPFTGFFWESWSLSVEEWFYILAPVLILLLKKTWHTKYAFLAATLAMIVLPLLYRFSILDPGINKFWWDVTFRKTVLCRLDSIGYGLLSAWVLYYYPTFWYRIKLGATVLGISTILLVINYHVGPASWYKQTIYFSIIPFSVMLLLPFAYSIKTGTGMLAKATEHISKISYSMYLINLALVAEVIRDNFAPQGGMDGVIKYAVFWIIVVLVSSLLYRFFEKPMMDLRDKPLWFQSK